MDRARDALRRLRGIAGPSTRPVAADGFSPGAEAFGLPVLSRRAVHEVFAATPEDASAAAGFAAGLAARAGAFSRPSLWVRHVGPRAGALYGGGFATLGLDPGAVIHLGVADEKDALRAAREGLRCEGLASVVIEIAGPARHLDLTATRRLKLAAAEYGVTALIVRWGADPGPSAAETRWQVAASLSASPGLALPGNPAMKVTLLKHRTAATGRIWELEWNHETRQFAPKTLSRPLAALPFDRAHREEREGRRASAR